jgi:hypothetical protein
MLWGPRPIEDRPVSLRRVEGREIVNPTLIIANDFGLPFSQISKSSTLHGA